MRLGMMVASGLAAAMSVASAGGADAIVGGSSGPPPQGRKPSRTFRRTAAQARKVPTTDADHERIRLAEIKRARKGERLRAQLAPVGEG